MAKEIKMAKYETKLSKDEEKDFKNWFEESKKNGVIHPDDNGIDYDFRGFWKNIIKDNKDAAKFNAETHFPDTYKKPNHETFSIESKYATGNMKKYAGSWDGDTYIPPKKSYRNRDAEDVLYE